MSLAEAAGCERSSRQSVSVVPMIQCPPHGMTKRTLVAVRRISPVSPVIAERGTTRCTPLEARTRIPGRSPTSLSIRDMSSVHTPVAAITVRARTSNSASGEPAGASRSRTRTPVTSRACRISPTARVLLTTAAPRLAAVRASVTTSRASSTCPS